MIMYLVLAMYDCTPENAYNIIGVFQSLTNAIKVARDLRIKNSHDYRSFDVVCYEAGVIHIESNIPKPIYTTEGDDIPW